MKRPIKAVMHRAFKDGSYSKVAFATIDVTDFDDVAEQIATVINSGPDGDSFEPGDVGISTKIAVRVLASFGIERK